ncbi:DUF4145 domain-containing protein [Pseudomonas sp. 18175]|uniref:DUF4145 domain-containing protein n=1 Tax=Pseudomonas sp. 18175 TaxID=3390056 RepID=UPI003D25FEE6
MQYVTPSFKSATFSCPYCQALSHMKWAPLTLRDRGTVAYTSVCTCTEICLWVPEGEEGEFTGFVEGFLVYPADSVAPMAESDMPDDVKLVFEEARQVFKVSPRAAAALLRLCVEQLCLILLKREKGDIHKMIGELVELGFPSRALKAFDTIRIFGNESVHPGTLHLNDTPDIAIILFKLLNLAVRHCISDDKELEEIRLLTPESKRRDL